MATFPTSSSSPPSSPPPPKIGQWSTKNDIDYANLPSQASPGKLYELSGIGDLDLSLESQLFSDRVNRAGEDLAALQLEAKVYGAPDLKPINTFAESGLHPMVLSNVARCGYEKTTSIQSYTVPAVLTGRDVVAVAQTGSGKTAAYLCPIISELMGKVDTLGGPRVDPRAVDYNPELHRVRAEPLVVIVCPTRELALQIFEETRRIAYRSQLRAVCCYGGIPVKFNLQQLAKGCDIIIGTPGRIVDLMGRTNVISMKRVKFTVIDEADEMLKDPDWEEALTKIVSCDDANEDVDHRYMMFSATFPKSVRAIAREYLQEGFIRISVGRIGSTHTNVTQEVIWADRNSKLDALYDMLMSIESTRVLIFCNSIAGVERVDDFLFNKGLPTAFVHSKRSQFEREDAMREFFRSKNPILITTAVAARGIDFPAVKLVVNYDLPSAEHGGIDEYVHRIGRTGRIGHKGKAVSFYNEGDERIAQDLVNILVESKQEVPDFLEQYKPEDGKVTFEDDSDDDKSALGDHVTGLNDFSAGEATLLDLGTTATGWGNEGGNDITKGVTADGWAGDGGFGTTDMKPVGPANTDW